MARRRILYGLALAGSLLFFIFYRGYLSHLVLFVVVLLPVSWLLSRTGILTLVWLAFPISELVSLVLSAIFLRRTMRAVTERIGGPAA